MCLVFAVSTYGFLWGPSMTLASHAYDDAGIAQVLGFALIGLTIGVGFFVGSAAGGEIAPRGRCNGVCIAGGGVPGHRRCARAAAGSALGRTVDADVDLSPSGLSG